MAAMIASTIPSTMGRVEMFDGTSDGLTAFVDPTTGETNIKGKKILDVKVQDVRARSPPGKFDSMGWELVKFPTKLTEAELLDHTSPEGKANIQAKYWTETAQLVKQYTGAAHVIPFHSRVRSQTLGYHPDEVFFMRTGVSQPASTVHVDNDHTTAMQHAVRELGEEGIKRLIAKHKRWAIVNVWRPIGIPVQQWPLLIVDHSRVGPMSYADDIARIYRYNNPEYVLQYKQYENWLKYQPERADKLTFWYASTMAPDEAILFKDYDCRTDRFRGTPHGGFQDSSSATDAPARRSVEVRLFVFFDNDNFH
ncbi:hypothetical protein GGS24DRAFT_503154 [Hypoxylon argillaceum]|nr:hypothetical protein GGS24DRAFT_503154 [Hypoxylon argillaceum]